ncbi:MAG: DotA/TraY family protein [Alphaproteobacteria bacterium]|nr:DotA/TraY family protein [Alphaproteobacteria bacterium]
MITSRTITAGKVAKYILLPQFLPRLRDLLAGGFGHVPYFIALVYQAVGLLPAHHAYLNPAYIGRYGIRHVVAEAANHLTFSLRNVDQILLFGTILVGLVLVFLQLALVAFSLFVHPVMAAMPTSFAGFFLTPEDTAPQDLAYILLDMVFGIPDVFNSCVSRANGEVCLDIDGTNGEPIRDTAGAWILQDLGWPFPIHGALHQLFQFYSIGLLVVATLITLYFIVTIVAETAQTGTAFGKRFNKVWAPVRLVVAFGLLIPVGYGLNSAQYIVLYAAKFGSGFATNGWNLFNEELQSQYLGQTENLISRPNVPEVGQLLQFMFTAAVCRDLETLFAQEQTASSGSMGNTNAPKDVRMYAVKNPLAPINHLLIDDNTSYESLVRFADGSQEIIIRFGIHDERANALDKGNVAPTCGQLNFRLKDPRVPGSDNPPEPGSLIMQKYYWFVIKELWFWRFPPMGYDTAIGGNCYYAYEYTQFSNASYRDCLDPPPSDMPANQQEFYRKDLEGAMLDPGAHDLAEEIGNTGALQAQVESGRWAVGPALRQKGWAGAAIWYNRVAELNGGLTGAVLSIPSISRYPEIMEYVASRKAQNNRNQDLSTRFDPVMADGKPVEPLDPTMPQKAVALWMAYDYWQKDGGVTTTRSEPTGNVVVDIVNLVFGTEGLMNMQKNRHVHPLAQLVGVGRSLIEATGRNLIGHAAEELFAKKIPLIGPIADVAGDFLYAIAMITMTIGFILFYVLPFLPFVYFFFAVGNWIKAIFEAMVGTPLWALAHIRIDGNGLPGQAAKDGYWMIVEIFLRPILIIIGFVGCITLFAASVSVLNSIWDLVTDNLTGFDARAEALAQAGKADPATGENLVSKIRSMRNSIDSFVFTIIYTIVVYMMALSSFKLIDLIPQQILRWLGVSIKPFGEGAEGAMQSFLGPTYAGFNEAARNLGGGLSQALKTAGKTWG